MLLVHFYRKNEYRRNLRHTPPHSLQVRLNPKSKMKLGKYFLLDISKDGFGIISNCKWRENVKISILINKFTISGIIKQITNVSNGNGTYYKNSITIEKSLEDHLDYIDWYNNYNGKRRI